MPMDESAVGMDYDQGGLLISLDILAGERLRERKKRIIHA